VHPLNWAIGKRAPPGRDEGKDERKAVVEEEADGNEFSRGARLVFGHFSKGR
jgi:hypothetical protein